MILLDESDRKLDRASDRGKATIDCADFSSRDLCSVRCYEKKGKKNRRDIRAACTNYEVQSILRCSSAVTRVPDLNPTARIR
jgi:hypothetical protein